MKIRTEQAPEYSEERCQAVTPHYGQCTNKIIPNTQFCTFHGGNAQLAYLERSKMRNYRLRKFQNRMEDFLTSPAIKSLREEIAILRMVLEEKLNQIDDPINLVLQAGPIGNLVLQINQIVSSCHKLELSSSRLLDREAIVQFSTQIVKILSENIQDEIILNKVSSELGELLSRIKPDYSDLINDNELD